MKFLFSPKVIALGLISGFQFQEDSVKSFFSSKVKQYTKTYIWGNGEYQPRPDAVLQFKNFEPKLIKTFLGKDKINLSQIYFGEFFESGIDEKGAFYIWKKKPLISSVEPDSKDDQREDVIKLEKEGIVQACFTKGFVWVLNNKGEVTQYQIQRTLNDYKEIINVQINNQPRKIKTLPPNVVQISAGEDHFVALTKEGEVYAMGDDTYGQCGVGAQRRSSAPPFYEKRIKNPVKVEQLPEIKKIVAGYNHNLAISRDGTLYGWGSNDNQQLSHEKEFSRVDEPLIAIYQPVKLTANLDQNEVIDVAAGEQISVIVTKNKVNQETEVFSCGYNVNGQLGLGYLRHVSDIAKIEQLSNYKIKNSKGEQEDIRIKQISCGSNHCMALLSIGAIMEWGQNEFGQLGNKKRTFSENPIIIGKFTKENVLNINCGYTSSAVITENVESPPQEQPKK